MGKLLLSRKILLPLNICHAWACDKTGLSFTPILQKALDSIVKSLGNALEVYDCDQAQEALGQLIKKLEE